MNELVEKLSTSFNVTKTQNSIYAAHPNKHLYKAKTLKSGDQDVRRKRYLEIQKEKRFDYKNHARKLALDQWSDGENEDDDEEEMEVLHVKPPRKYANQLMLSEWMVEKPEDFEKNWALKVCPIGKRNLIIGSRGYVSCYTRSGYRLFTFRSEMLPGGNTNTIGGYTVLDCIYVEKDRTFYILDVMCWNQHAFYDCDTIFRFFWLNGKFKEMPENSETDSSYKFKQIEFSDCSNDVLLKFLSSYDESSVDGLLFYHKENHYTFGETPLVLWLKPNMIEDMFKITKNKTEEMESKKSETME